MEDLKELIIQTLDAAGVLDKIRAQLRLQVFKAVQNDEGKMQNDNSKPVKMAQNPEGTLAAALFRDFLECYKMKYSLNVLIPEFHLPATQDVRAFLAKELKFTPEPGEPYLSFMMNYLLKNSDSSGLSQFREEEKTQKKKEDFKEPKTLPMMPDLKIKAKEEPKPVEKKPLAQIPEFKSKPEEPKPIEKKPLAQIPEFKGKPAEEKPVEKKPLAQIPEFKGKVEDPKPVEKKPLAQIPEFKGKPEEPKPIEKKPLGQIPEFKGKPVEEVKKPLAQIPEFKGPKPTEEKPPEKKPLGQIPEFKGKPVDEPKPVDKKIPAQIPEFKGKQVEEKPAEKKTLAQIPEFKGSKQPEEVKKPEEKKPATQIPEFKGKQTEEKPSEKKTLAQIPEFKGSKQPEEAKKPLAQIPDFKGKAEEKPSEKKTLAQIPDFKGKKQEPVVEDKNKNPQGKGKIPQIMLPDIDSPESSGRFEESHDKDAIDDVKKRLQNYGNYIEEVGDDISNKKFEFENYGESEEYEESGEYYAELSDDPSMHSEYLDDYDIIEDAEIVQSEDEDEEEEEEGSSNS
ncbi:hypothetical protein SteCoe_29749 [Stentor coeruleus]|uniref:FGFR1 oncogene partner (FOP) N-terminal dimerisation domain-containing protein n=1 Tax=Stentor coeruleus TaxID=5963 RepID=A0A1R2B570_9CILI|nr:hypothetical protein SteCoe_29749 [Stentor coeruleus]